MVNIRKLRCSRRKSESSISTDEKTREPVSFIQLFRWASRTDKILIAVSVTAALFNGICLPFSVILFGDLANVIVYETSPIINASDSNNSTQCQSSSESVFK